MNRKWIGMALAAGGLLALVGCQSGSGGGGGADGPLPAGSETAQMKPEPGVSEGWTYRDPKFDPKSYSKVMVDPQAHVYQGEGADYGSLSPEEVQKLAQMIPEETIKLLRARDYMASEAGPGVLELRFTVLRVSSTVPYAATVTRLIPMSALVNVGRTALGEGGSLTGSLTILVEARDSETQKVLVATQRLVRPGTFDLESTLGTEQTARAVAQKVAENIVERMDRVAGGS
ncbi:DUF3313 domain-containing protein [Geminicoccus roseus]|uniref:DUF3313 domain-containing protein n=1 Tax=Geminicoccus roseus TaxID=404900 RepID=UPI0004833797|nr:DUF3313 domain-containing protein [Geminicoccus roseus]